MAKLIFACLFCMLANLYARAQSVTNTSWTSDSIQYDKSDTTPATTADAEMYHIFQNLDTSLIPSHILIDRTITITDINKHIGDTVVDSPCTYSSVLGAINALNGAGVDTNAKPFPSILSINDTVQYYVNNGITPITILSANYDQLEPHAVDNGWINITSGQFNDVPGQNPYMNKYTFVAATSKSNYRSFDFIFRIPSYLFLTNLSESPSSIQIDFHDGNGYQTVAFDQNINIHYPDLGLTSEPITLDVKVIYLSSTKEAKIHIKVRPFRNGSYGTYTSTWTFASTGSHSGGTATVALGCGSMKLRKPLIVVKGFDPTNDFHYQDFINMFNPDEDNQIALKNDINNGGYDIVFVDYNNNLDDITRNGRYLEAVINRVNSEKAANGSTEPNVVIGISMGGLISRWILKTMENESHVHDVKTFISFDAPQRGAYVPLCSQYLIQQFYRLKFPTQDYVKNQIVDVDGHFPIIDFYNVLESPAAKQMLVMQAHDFGADNPIANLVMTPLNTSFFSGATTFLGDLLTLGYPSSCRNVSISCGSQVVQNQGLSAPLTTMANITGTIRDLSFFNPDVNFTLNTLPDRTASSPQNFYHGGIGFTFVGHWWVSDVDVAAIHTDHMENTPGGVFDIDQFGNDIVGQIRDNLPDGLSATIAHTAFSFIPTVSGLDIKAPQSNDPFFNESSAGIIANSETPYKNYTALNLTSGIVNDLHAQFTDNNFHFFEKELGIYYRFVNAHDTSYVITSSYNFGSDYVSASTAGPYDQTTDHIGNVEFSGCTMYINGDQPIGKSTSGLPHPTHASDFHVFTASANCNNFITVTIDNDAHLVIGNGTYGNTGTLWLDSGSNLVIYGDATLNGNCKIIVQKGAEIYLYGALTLNDNSSIIVEKGGHLNYFDGATVDLVGSNSFIDIRGSLFIDWGATFSLTSGSAGYMKFTQNTSDIFNNITGGGIFYLSSSSQSNKVLEVAGGEAVNPGDDISLFHIATGKVVLGAGCRLDIKCPITLDHVTITSTSGTQNHHRGLNIYGQSEVVSGVSVSAISLDHVDCSYGDYGIYAYLGAYDFGTTFSHVTATDCGIGVYVLGAWATFDHCTFTDCGSFGWKADLMGHGEIVQSKISQASLSSTAVGIQINCDPGGGFFTIDQSKIINHNIAVQGTNNSFAFGPSVITGNNIGVYGTTCDVVLDPSHAMPSWSSLTPGSADISQNNTYAIQMMGSGSLYISGGTSNLSSSVSGSKTIFMQTSNCISSITANSNMWVPSGGSGPAGTYNASTSCPPPPGIITINDASHLPSFSSYYTGPSNPIDRTELKDKEFEQFNVGNAHLTSNIHDAMMALQNGNYLAEIRIFNNCINDYLQMNHPDDELLYRMYMHLVSGLNMALSSKQLNPDDADVESIINTQDLIFRNLNLQEEYYLRYAAIFDKAGIKRLQNKRPEALTILEQMQTWVKTSQIKQLQYLHCIMNAEQTVINGAAKKEEIERLVKECQKFRPLVESADPSLITETNLNVLIDNPVIYPNPAENMFNIILNGSGTTDLMTTINSVDGKTVYSNVTKGLLNGQNVFNVQTSGLQPGIYFVHLNFDGKDYCQKLVITKSN
jgi:hypothetical protein